MKINKSSVWEERVELRKGKLNSLGYFDFKKMKILLKIVDKKILEEIRPDILQTHLDIKYHRIYAWKNRQRIPFSFAEKIFGQKKLFELIDSNKLKLYPELPLIPEELENIIEYIKPSDPDVYVNSKIPKKSLEKLSKYGTIKSYKPIQKGYRLLSRKFNTFLKEFYEWYKTPKIDLIKEINSVKSYIKNSPNLDISLIGPLILSDGSNANRRNRLGISFFGNGIELHVFLAAAFYKEFNVFPTSFFVPANTTNVTYYNNLEHQKSLKKLFNIFRNFKTSPRKPVTKKSIKKYLMEEEPTLKNVLIADKRTKELAIRAICSAEGTVYVDSRFNPRISVGCAHPSLNNEIRKILSQLKISSRKIKDARTWSGIGGFEISRKKEVEKFIEIGGFLPKVKVTSRSKLYNGIEKQKLLLTFLEIKKGIGNGKIKIDNRKDLHKEVLIKLGSF